MQSFHNDIAVKCKYVARTEKHRKADELIRGTGWDGSKGCAVGCTLEKYDHSQYPIELGLPEWLARVEDTLFEGMSLERAMLWPSEFLLAIPVGVTENDFLYKVKAPFIRAMLEGTLKNFDNEKFPDVASAVQGSIALWSRDDLEAQSWESARSAAWSAAASAWSAAWSARSARSAESAARSAAYDGYADKLLELLRNL